MITGHVEHGPAQRLKLTDQIAQQILARIAAGELRPGDRLESEPRLADQLKVGRSSLREALQSLAGLGILHIRHGKGVYVADAAESAGLRRLDVDVLLASRDVLDLVETRKVLELETVELAIERAQGEELAEIAVCVARMRRATTRTAYLDADMAFHVAIARAAHNQVIERLIQSLRDMIVRTLWQSPVGSDEGTRQHSGILEAIQARDAPRARRLMYEHLHETEMRVRGLLDRETQP